jgi:hypothetical protein
MLLEGMLAPKDTRNLEISTSWVVIRGHNFPNPTVTVVFRQLQDRSSKVGQRSRLIYTEFPV